MIFSITGYIRTPLLFPPRKRKTEHQRRILLASFQSNPYLDSAEKHRLAELLNISERHVQHFFNYARFKQGKMHSVKRLSKDQTKTLMEKFRADPKLTSERTTQLAKLMNISEKTIRHWFVYARYKIRRKALHEGMTESQRQILKDSFQANRYLSDAERCRLAKLLNTRRGTITDFFSTTRMEETQQKRLFQRESTF